MVATKCNGVAASLATFDDPGAGEAAQWRAGRALAGE
jgi:hypothetical protein